MTSRGTKYRLRLGEHIVLGRELVRGSEGTIHEIDMLSDNKGKKYNAKKFVAKKYFESLAEKTAKLEAMLAHEPTDPTYRNPETLGHISIAWPQALIINESNECVGFIMPYINQQESFPLQHIYHPEDRRNIKVYDKQKQQEVFCEFTWVYLLRMAYNLAEIIKELHSKGYVVGDLNESNILVTASALVTLVDCDSMQVPQPGYPAYFCCPTGRPEYTPPDLQGQDFSQIDRVPDDDNFGLAVLIFLLLMEGQHPFAGVWHGSGPPPTLVENMREYDFPYVGSGTLKPPQNALPLEILPPEVQKLMRRCFTPPSSSNPRPTAQEWAQTLEKAETELRECQRSPLHVYSKHLRGQCPWCARMERGIPDPFPLAGMASQVQSSGQHPTLSLKHGQPSKPGYNPASTGIASQAQSTGPHQPLAPNYGQPSTRGSMVSSAGIQAQSTGPHQPLAPNYGQPSTRGSMVSSAGIQAQSTGPHQPLAPNYGQPSMPGYSPASTQAQTTGQQPPISPQYGQASMQGYSPVSTQTQTAGQNPQVSPLPGPTPALTPAPALGQNPPSPPLQSAQLSQQQPLPAGNGLSMRHFGLVCCLLLVFLVYVAEVIIIYYMQAYIPSLLQVAPIGVFIALVIYVFAPVVVFFVALKKIKAWLDATTP